MYGEYTALSALWLTVKWPLSRWRADYEQALTNVGKSCHAHGLFSVPKINISNRISSVAHLATLEDDQLRSMPAPNQVDDLQWNLSSPRGRRELLLASISLSTDHVVSSGETAWQIARDHGLDLATLLKANTQIKNPHLIYPGQVISIPGQSAAAAIPQIETANEVATSSAGNTNSVMHSSDTGLEFIANHEGLVLKLYNDSAGYTTVGVEYLVHRMPINGATSEASFTNGISRKQVMDLLRGDAIKAEFAIRQQVTVPLNQNQFDALVSFVFNVGAGNFSRSTLLEKLNQGNYESVPGELMRWNKVRVNDNLQVLPGLTTRRQDEGNLFFRPNLASEAMESLTSVVPEQASTHAQQSLLRRGLQGAEVANLQTRLKAISFYSVSIDGLFGTKTETAVRSFQRAHGLSADGVVGPQTWEALAVMPSLPIPDGNDVTVGQPGSAADLWRKSGVNIRSLKSEIRSTFDDIVAVWKANNGPTPVITSGNDGTHKENSLHFSNLAIDLRANNISDAKARAIAVDLQVRLGSDYDVIFEHYPKSPSNDHIHLEYDPE